MSDTIQEQESRIGQESQTTRINQLLSVVEEMRDLWCEKKFDALCIDYSPSENLQGFFFSYDDARLKNEFLETSEVPTEYFVAWVNERAKEGKILIFIDAMGRYFVCRTEV